MESEKKKYTTPKLITHGDLKKITQYANNQNSDDPQGTTSSSDAFPWT